MPELSKLTDNLIGQHMFNLLAKARSMENEGRKIIHFEIGDPNFTTPVNVIQATKRAIDHENTHYVNSMGKIEFREAIVDYVYKNSGFKPLVEQVLVCPANAVIDFTIRCIANIGDEIIHPDPGFCTYYSAIKYNGMIPVGVPLKEENNFCMKKEDIIEKITDTTKLIIINSPNNPTGSVMTQNEILEIASLNSILPIELT